MPNHLETADGRQIPIHDDFVLGRVAGCNFVVHDAKASRRHARFIVQGGVVEIEDLESHNGTLLNGKPVQRRVLRDGDQIQIGATVLRFRSHEAEGVKVKAPEAVMDELDFGTATASQAPPANPATPPAPAAPPTPARPTAATAATAATAPTTPAARPEPSVRSAPAPAPAPVPAAGPAPARANADRVEVVEFADEVVQVRASPAPPPRPGATRGANAAAAPPARRAGVLQFQRPKEGPAVLGDDLRQMAPILRVLCFVGLLAAGCGIAYGVMLLMR